MVHVGLQERVALMQLSLYHSCASKVGKMILL